MAKIDIVELCNKLDTHDIRYKFQDEDTLLVMGRFLVQGRYGRILDTRRKRNKIEPYMMFTEIERVRKKNEKEGRGYQ